MIRHLSAVSHRSVAGLALCDHPFQFLDPVAEPFEFRHPVVQVVDAGLETADLAPGPVEPLVRTVARASPVCS